MILTSVAPRCTSGQHVSEVVQWEVGLPARVPHGLAPKRVSLPGFDHRRGLQVRCASLVSMCSAFLDNEFEESFSLEWLLLNTR